MRAAIFHGPGTPLTIEDRPLPVPGAGEVLVKVCRCGVCGSDVSMTGDAPFTFAPGPIGHEFAGEIVEAGSGVAALKAGRRVACLASIPCGACAGCRNGNPVFCLAPRRGIGGGFGEYVTIPAAGALALPESLSFGDGALIEPMACGLHALRLARLDPGAHVLVLGAGSMALSIIYWARRFRAGRIVVASRSAHRREIAMAMGADAFHSFADDDPADLASLLGDGPDLVAECVGKAGMLGEAVRYVRPQGTVVSLGMCQKTEPVMPAMLTFKEVRLLFPVAYSVEEFAETARAFDADGVHPEMMVSDVIGLDALPRVLEDMRNGTHAGLKVHVDPGRR
ncbi:zinc-binding dehydrogenase [Sphingomonas solaris]|uniref:Zinc-binding dehydrogenase n=2 Tax=Alterirhizorhabdus solaris TaxID=2529389 RepID=A0A558R931_9SPHN|nr:zinc-binding dehydrogenase [Sphingomonas solaris]